MKKLGLGILIIGVLVISGVALAAANGPAGQRAYVLTDNSVVKAILGVNHEFPGVFSTKVSPQLKVLSFLGLIKIEPVRLYQVMPPNKCGDGVCQGYESPQTCPEDCGIIECNPDNQKPWGIVKVNGGSGGEGATVAVLDTGIDTDHPDLVGNIVDCVAFGYTTCEDGHGHGTHTAGTVAANGKILGVAPQASLFAIKVCNDSGGCWGDDIAAGIIYAADKGVNIVSMSIGGDTQDVMVTNAIDYAVSKDVLVIAAAGNDRKDGAGSIDYPGAYVKSVAVAAFDSKDVMASFSSLGVNDGDWVIEEKEIELAAPGVLVESTYNNGCYAYYSGTSMATPHVSGIAARDWQGSALTTRTYLQGLARYYTENIFDYGQMGDDIEAGFGLPVAPSCLSDTDCNEGEICCSGNCVVSTCLVNADCDDNNACTEDVCNYGGFCEAVCSYTDKTQCENGDGCCPADCDYTNDTDCPVESCDSCFKGKCDGKCNPAKENETCSDCW